MAFSLVEEHNVNFINESVEELGQRYQPFLSSDVNGSMETLGSCHFTGKINREGAPTYGRIL